MAQLNRAELILLSQQLEADKTLSTDVKNRILALVAAESSEDRLQDAINKLPYKRRLHIAKLFVMLVSDEINILSRGRGVIQDISEDDWQALVDEAIADAQNENGDKA